MTIDDFWVIVNDASGRASGSNDQFIEVLRASLAGIDADDVVEFKRRLQDCVQHAYTWPLMGAAHIIQDGCMHEEFEYFCAWLISRGRHAYDAAVRNPDSLADIGIDHPSACDLERLLELPAEVYHQSTGRPFPHNVFALPEEPEGVPWDDDGGDLQKRLPRLWEKYRG